MRWPFSRKIFLKTPGFRIIFAGAEYSFQNFIKTRKLRQKKDAHVRDVYGAGGMIKADRGSVLIICCLVIALFVTLGLGLLLNAQLFFQVQASKKMNRLNDYASENGAKQVLAKAADWADKFPCGEISEQLFQNLKAALLSSDERPSPLLESLLSEAAISRTDDFSRFVWETSPSVRLKKLEDYSQYLKSTYELTIDSAGQVEGFRWKKAKQVDLEISFFLGRLPLDRLPLAVRADGLKKEDEQKITISHPHSSNLKQDKIIKTAETAVPDDALPLLAKGLKLFRPDGLPNWLLRRSLGLDPGNEKVPDGVYLAKDDLGPGGLYVQGDLDQLLLGVDGDYQLIQFRQKERRWLLLFSLKNYGCEFWTDGGKEEYDRLPLPIIMVNGQINSLATGQKTGSGWLEPTDEPDRVAYLSGLKLILVCSGKVNITSNLLVEGLTWKEGLPYLREKQSQFIIWSTARDFQTQESTDGGINLFDSGQEVLKIAANLVAGGEGMKTNGLITRAEIIGSLSATAINLNTTSLSLFQPPPPPVETDSDLSVYSTTNLLFLDEIKLKEWRTVK